MNDGYKILKALYWYYDSFVSEKKKSLANSLKKDGDWKIKTGELSKLTKDQDLIEEITAALGKPAKKPAV